MTVGQDDDASNDGFLLHFIRQLIKTMKDNKQHPSPLMGDNELSNLFHCAFILD